MKCIACNSRKIKAKQKCAACYERDKRRERKLNSKTYYKQCITCFASLSRASKTGLCKFCYQKQYYNTNRKSNRVTNKSQITEGKLFGSWKVLGKTTDDDRIKCLCIACNKTERLIYYNSLFRKQTTHCGCLLKGSKLKKNQVYNCWRILEEKKKGNVNILCECIYCSLKKEINYLVLLNNRNKKCSCLDSRKAIGEIKTLSDGRSLIGICSSLGVNWHNAYDVYRKFGEETFLEYCNNYKGVYTSSLEIAFMSLLSDVFSDLKKFNKNPIEFKTKYRPDFRIARNNRVLYVNVDGLYYHSTISPRKLNKQYHMKMAEDFKNNNQILFQFYADEIQNKSQVIKSMICNYLRISINLINARSCTINKVSSNEANVFVDENHLMGRYKASSYYGLYYNNDLVAIMGIRKSKNFIEIARFCTKKFTSIRGGFSKLLKYVENLYKPKNVISYCDLRYSIGHSYQKLGFKLESISLGWKWTDGYKTYNRLRCRANMDERKLSQAEYAKELGWYKIYDAGQAKYIKQLG